MDNLLINNNYVLKIADFGFAAPIEGRDGHNLLYTRTVGTSTYRAPEIKYRKAGSGYDG